MKRVYRWAGSLALLSNFWVQPALGATPSAYPDLTALSLEELSNLEVTSVSKTPEKWFKAGAAISVITQEDIQRSGVTSIAEALRMAPGVEVERISSSLWSIGIRGFSDRLARSVLVLMDGRAVYAPLFAGTYWEVQDYPLEDIDRIEVIRGPGGTLWGANAFNGVINIITKSAQETQGGMITGGGGTEERGFGSLRYGWKTGDRSYFRVYGKYFDRGASFHPNDNDFDPWDMGQGGFRSDWSLDDRDSFTLQGDLYKGKTGNQLAVASYEAPFSRTITDDANLFGANVLGRWKRAISTTSGLALQTYYDRTNREDLNFREFRDTFDIDFQNNFSLPFRQDLTWGLGYRLTANHLDSIPTIVFDPKNRTDRLGNIFIQDQIAVIEDRLQLTMGSKVEHNDYSGWEYEPSGRLTWTPTDRQTAWASVSRAVRTPSQVDQDLYATLPVSPVLPFFLRQAGNPDFKTEELIAYEAGYRVQPVDTIVLSAAGFYNRYDNLLTGEIGSSFLEMDPSPAHTILPVVLVNELKGETHGLELTTSWRMLPIWRWRATYSLLLMHLRSKTGVDAIHRSANLEGSSPRHQAWLESSIDLPGRVSLNPTLRYTDVLVYQGIPSYWNLDAKVAWRPVTHLEFALVGQNLLQKHHPESSPNATPTTSVLPLEIQRGFYGKATWWW